MEKKVRVKRLNHQDDAKRSWTATYPLIEDFEGILAQDLERAQAELDPTEDDTSQIQSSAKRRDAEISEK